MIRLLCAILLVSCLGGCGYNPFATYPETTDPTAIVGMDYAEWRRTRAQDLADQRYRPKIIDGVRYDDVVLVGPETPNSGRLHRMVIASKDGKIIDVMPNGIIPGETPDADAFDRTTTIPNRDGSYTNVVTHPSGRVYISR